jgi:RND family efflux transporter MFP subunit
MKKLQLFLLIPFLLLNCKKKQEEEAEVLRPVRFEEVSIAGGTRVRNFSGVAQSGVETRLSFKIPGTIQRADLKVGQQVRAGQLIASLDASDYVLQYEEADAAVKNADAQEKNARSNYERVTLLYENQNASLSEYEAARTAYESARANESSLKQRRKLAKLQVDYTKLYAPLDGVIANVFVEENENVQSGQQIVILNSGSDIEVVVTVPELYISRIKEGDEVDLVFTSLPDKTYQGKVTEVAYASARAETTFPVTIKVLEPGEDIRPGMAAEVSFTFVYEESEEKLVVTAFAVGEDQEGNYVFTVMPSEEDQHVGFIEKKHVSTGQITEEGIVIVEGLDEGDLVITAGISRITDGMKVKLLN